MVHYAVAFCFVLNFLFLKDLHFIQYVVYTVLYLFSTLSSPLTLIPETDIHHIPQGALSPTFRKTFEFQFYHLKEVIPLIVSNMILGETNIASIRVTHKG